MKKLLTLMLASGALLGATTVATGCNNNANEIADQNKTIEALQEQINTLTKTIETLTKSLEAVGGNNAELQKVIAELNKQLEDLRKELDTINAVGNDGYLYPTLSPEDTEFDANDNPGLEGDVTVDGDIELPTIDIEDETVNPDDESGLPSLPGQDLPTVNPDDESGLPNFPGYEDPSDSVEADNSLPVDNVGPETDNTLPTYRQVAEIQADIDAVLESIRIETGKDAELVNHELVAQLESELAKLERELVISTPINTDGEFDPETN